MRNLVTVQVPVVGRASCPFQIGDTVRLKNPNPAVALEYYQGIVEYVPEVGAQIVELAGHTLGNDIRVRLPGGSAMIGNADQFELVS